MKRVLDLIKFEKDRIVDAREIVEKASQFQDKCVRGGKETRLKFMGELYDAETILNRLEEQVNILIKADEKNVCEDIRNEKVEMFKELTLEDIIKGLGAVLQPVPTEKEKTREEIEEEKKREEIERLKKKAIKTFKYPPRVFDRIYYDRKYCKLLCDVVVDGNYNSTFGKVFKVEYDNGFEVSVKVYDKMVKVPREYVSFI